MEEQPQGALLLGGCKRRHDLHIPQLPSPSRVASQEPQKGPGALGGPDCLSLPPGDPGESLCLGSGAWGVGSVSSETLHKAAREEARAAVPLQGPLVPAVFSLLVHKDYVAFLQLNLGLALGRI